MHEQDLAYRTIQPPADLAAFVESCWMLVNHSGEERSIVVLPDGRVDIIFSWSDEEPFHVALLGLELAPSQTKLLPGAVLFAVSLRLLAVEYLLKSSVAHLLNHAVRLPDAFWGMTAEDPAHFDAFCDRLMARIRQEIKAEPDNRRKELFDLLYASNGAVTVQELSGKVFWSARQINRYFNQQFGLSLKTYCSILRFRAAFSQIRQGKLFPSLSFADQAHFIREVKKYAGVTPGALHRNKNDRFIQFSTLPRE